MAGSEVTGGTAFAGEPEVFSTNGSVTNSTGGPKIFNIRLLTRRSSGVGNSSDVTGRLGGSGGLRSSQPRQGMSRRWSSHHTATIWSSVKLADGTREDLSYT